MSGKGENIYKRKDGRREGRFKKGVAPNGRTLYRSCYGKTYREVKEKLQKSKQSFAVQPNPPKQNEKKTFGEYCALRVKDISLSDKTVTVRETVQRIKKYSETCGIEDLHFHVLRHTFATRCVEVGFEIKSLSEVPGHSTPRITLERYVHSSLEFKRQNMTKPEAIGMQLPVFLCRQ